MTTPPTPRTRNAVRVSMCSTSQPKFCPKNPVTRVSGSRIVAIRPRRSEASVSRLAFALK
jgi:hypothetical protein